MADKTPSPLEESEVRLGPPIPRTVSLAWLFHNVPWKFWIGSLSMLVAVFIAGIEFAQIAWVRDLAWKSESRIVDATSPVVTDTGKPASAARSESPTPSQASEGRLREGSAREVVNYFATIAPLQKKPLFESSYKGRRVSWQGSVTRVTDEGGEYHVYVWDKGQTSEREVLISLSVPRSQQSLVERLREGDRVAFDGVIQDFDLADTFQIKVGSLAIVPIEKSSPTPTRKANR